MEGTIEQVHGNYDSWSLASVSMVYGFLSESRSRPFRGSAQAHPKQGLHDLVNKWGGHFYMRCVQSCSCSQKVKALFGDRSNGQAVFWGLSQA